MIDAGRERELVQRATEARLVEERARCFARRYPRCALEEDLREMGNVALAAIVREYDDARGGFADFCRRRLDYAMLDGIRAETRQQRNDRAAQRAAAELLALYRNDPGALPLDRLRTLAEVVAAATFAAMTEEALRGGEDELAAREEYATAHAVLKSVLEVLPTPQRRLLVLVYHEQKTLTYAKEELGVHYNTVERWHKKTLAAIRKQLEARGIARAPSRSVGPRMKLGVLRGDGDS
jgi:RNA polymerase sigma factor (sigma-70 family)